jgi:hypothetical protein
VTTGARAGKGRFREPTGQPPLPLAKSLWLEGTTAAPWVEAGENLNPPLPIVMTLV